MLTDTDKPLMGRLQESQGVIPLPASMPSQAIVDVSLRYVMLSDTDKPLMGRLQESQGVIPLPASMPSQAIVDVSENMRAKIYAMFGKIGT